MAGTEPGVQIYTTAWCGYCSAAKRLLQSKGVAFEEIKCDGAANLRRELAERTGSNTVPQIFIADEAIGGYDDIAALEAAGKLDPMLGIS
jgi:glutaredoxin 3